ncbi:MAG: DNA repair protein RecN [Clostridia bacterium]|nr:DNA repair protein RecN [Clostridia bacterium]
MLRSLRVKNIALIDDCTLVFGEKLNVLSGETGAGKSVIIDSLGFALGARADKSLIRHGQDTASVEAVFDLSDAPQAAKVLSDMGIEAEDGLLIIYRTMSEARSDIRMNGRMATLSMLREVASLLVDILGQHEHQSLLAVSTHIQLLDKYGEESISPLKAQVATLYHEYKGILKELSQYGDESERIRRLDVLKYQIEEISAAELQEGEEEKLLAARDRFRNAEKILNAVHTAKSVMDGDDAYSVLSALSSAMTALRQASSYDKDLENEYERLDASYTEIKDIIGDLESYIDGFDFDGASADRVEKRVDLIRSLKRKYGGSESAVLESLDAFREEYDRLVNASEDIAALEMRKDEVYSELLRRAASLSASRKKCAQNLRQEIEKELSELGMKGSKFDLSFVSGEEYLGADGFDAVEFLISPNPGEPLRSLSKIISGGEMSRFMLALKVITARLDGISTLVFDEIDTGISGKIGEVVAEKLMLVSSTRQVLVITHLPQVAAMSDDHYLIEKKTIENKTFTTILRLDEDGVIGEIERLSAGVGEYGTLHAKELRARALSLKG